MPFAEPRPHRRPFHAFKEILPLIVSPSRKGLNLALTSVTISSQGGDERFVQVLSRGGTGDIVLLMVLVKGGQTIHLDFPHPIMVGEHRKLVVIEMKHTGALLPTTVAGYEWRAADDN